MAKENSRERKLKYAFGANKKVELLYVTSDDQMFTNKSDAVNHSRSLEDQTVESAERRKYVGGPSEAEVAAAAAAEAEAERDELIAEFVELFGKEPAVSAKNEDIRAKIDEELKRLKTEAAADAVKIAAAEAEEREKLAARHMELFDKAPQGNMLLENLRKKVEDEEAQRASVDGQGLGISD